MKKIFFQGFSLVALFFAAWFILQQVDWMAVFKVEQVTRSTEEKLGDLFWEIFGKEEKDLRASDIIGPVDSILTKICNANDIDRSQIKLHVLNNEEVNAFALPNKHLVIFSGLILASENEAELSGVIGHELAHIQLNHVMKKLMKEVGLSVLISMTTGGSGTEIIRETAKMLSSSAFDRKLEREADIKSVDYLLKADIQPEPFADFLFRLGQDQPEMLKNLTWISTHPESKERAEYIIEYSRGRSDGGKPVLGKEAWDALQQTLGELQ